MINKLFDIINSSERATVQLAYKLRNHLKKLSRFKNHLTFLLKCRDHRIVPRGLRIHLPVRSSKARLISLRASEALIRERIGFIRRQKIKIHLDMCSTRFLLRTSTSETIVNHISQWAEHHELEEFNTVKKQQQKKFKTLLEEKLQHQLAQLASSVEPKTVVNLSSKPLSEDQTKLLSLGLNFALPPSTLPKEDIIARTEQIAGMMKDQGQHLREEVSRCLRKNKLPIKFNLIRQEGVALKKLLMEDDHLIMKSE